MEDIDETQKDRQTAIHQWAQVVLEPGALTPKEDNQDATQDDNGSTQPQEDSATQNDNGSIQPQESSESPLSEVPSDFYNSDGSEGVHLYLNPYLQNTIVILY